MQKGFGLIGILIVVALVAGMGVFMFDSVFPEKSPFTPSEEEKSAIDRADEIGGETSDDVNVSEVSPPNVDMTGWKTYRNEEYGFEVKYPPNFKQEGIYTDGSTVFSFCEGPIEKFASGLGPEGIEERCLGKNYRFSISGHDTEFNPGNLVDSNMFPYPDKIKKISLAGKDFYIARWKSNELFVFVGWSAQTSTKDGRTIDITFMDDYVIGTNAVIEDNELKEVEKILSTFKFTN